MSSQIKTHKIGPFLYESVGNISVISFRDKVIYERMDNLCCLFGLTFRIW